MRDCQNCPVVDDHPRVQYQDGVNPDGTPRVLLFHYDCTPRYVRESADDGAKAGYAAADSGKRGSDVAAAVADAVAKESA